MIRRRPGRCDGEAVVAVRTSRRHIIGVESDKRAAAAGAATIGTVGALVADAAPPAPVAVTVAVSVFPASAETGVYVAPSAPAITAPFRAHWYANEVAPVQVPVVDVWTLPTWAVPEITGNELSTGAAAAAVTADVGALVTDAEPPGPVAVTMAVSVCPTSLETGVYVEAVAPAIAAPLPAHL